MGKTYDNGKVEQPELIDITVIFKEFFHTLKRTALFSIAVILMCSGMFTIYRTITYDPVYTAYSTFIISINDTGNSGNNYYNSSTALQMEKTFPYIITSDIVQKNVAEELDMDKVPGEITVSASENTNLFTIRVTDSDPQRAYDTLQALLKVYPDYSESIIGKAYMELMDENSVPTSPDNPNSLVKNIVYGAILGVLVAMFIVFVRTITNKTVRKPEDCIKRINTKCIGAVPFVKDKVRSRHVEQGKNICKPEIDPEFVESFRMIRNKIEHESRNNHYNTIMITSAMPGEGKSTVSANIALSLAMAGKKVALVDCDLRNPSASKIVGEIKGKGFIDYLKGEAKLQECFVKGVELYGIKLPVLLVRGGKGVQDGTKYLYDARMKRAIKVLKKQMDYVILDTAPAGLMTDAAILAPLSDYVIFVVKKDYTKANKIIESMESVSLGNVQIMGCVLNGVE